MSEFQCEFPGKEKDEKVILLLKRHWVVFIYHALLSIFYALIPLVCYFVIYNFIPMALEAPVGPVLILLTSLYYIFIWLHFFISWSNYYFDVWIITDRRLVDIEQISLFDRVVSQLKLNKVQDITAEVKGVFPTIFHFGNVYVQTAGMTSRFVLEQVKNPYKVKDLLIKLHAEYEERYINSLLKERIAKGGLD